MKVSSEQSRWERNLIIFHRHHQHRVCKTWQSLLYKCAFIQLQQAIFFIDLKLLVFWTFCHIIMGGIYAVYGYMAIVSFGLFFSLLRAVEVILDVDVISECKLNKNYFWTSTNFINFFQQSSFFGYSWQFFGYFTLSCYSSLLLAFDW